MLMMYNGHDHVGSCQVMGTQQYQCQKAPNNLKVVLMQYQRLKRLIEATPEAVRRRVTSSLLEKKLRPENLKLKPVRLKQLLKQEQLEAAPLP
jgi:hypothetical protein